MLKLLRTLINNGFVVLALLVAVTLYLAYGQKQTAHQHEAVAAAADTAPTPPAPAVDKTAEAPSEPSATTRTAEANASQPPATPVPQPDTVPAAEAAGMTPAQPVPAAPATASNPADKAAASEHVAGAKTAQGPAPETAPAAAAPASPDDKTATQSAGTEKDRKAASVAPGLLFDPTRLDHRAILSRFEGPRQALAEAHAATRAGDYQWATAIYFSLLKVHPDADIAGQLGNVLWRIGDRTWAHRAWRYAAQLLIREGRIDTARAFARNIRKVDAALADEIEAHLPKTDTQLRKAQP